MNKRYGTTGHRTKWLGHSTRVRVKYDEHQEFHIVEDQYRARGYQLPFDQLPWRNDTDV